MLPHHRPAVVGGQAQPGGESARAPAAEAAPRRLRVHYVRRDRNYKGWGLHAWGDAAHTEWGRPLPPSGSTADGPYWDVPLAAAEPRWAGVLLHKGDERAAAEDRIELSAAGLTEVWLVGAEQQKGRRARPDPSTLPAGDLTKAYAHWLDRGTIAWRVAPADGPGPDAPQRVFHLHYSPDASLRVTPAGVEGAALTLPLAVAGANIPSAANARFPHLYGCTWLALPEEHWGQIPELLRGQLAVSVASPGGAPNGGPGSGPPGAALDAIDATGVQLAGVLDDTCATDEPLGANRLPDGRTAVSVWAPTARSVELLRWRGPRGGEAEVVPMAHGPRGVWTAESPPGESWDRTYYKFRLSAFHPATGKIETVEATDPYSRCTCANGERSLVVGLRDDDLQPPGWRAHAAPPLPGGWGDISIYELHIRDFSATDATVPEALRGKYRAFCPQHTSPGGAGASDGSSSGAAASGAGAGAGQAPGDAGGEARRLTAGQAHLAALAGVGLTHLHLLPSYDFGSVPEREEEQQRVQDDLSRYPPDSEAQQAAVAAVADQDAFNWGYDPVHYGVPEGSYSTQPDGPLRVLEYREMVQALHGLGLRVVADVVYNHTFASGPHARFSVLDKIVPGYYHRRGEDGEVLHSTCCNNTASEHAMMLRLMVDDLTHWARDYKIDGFRFDIMGHHMVDHMLAIRSALDRLTPEPDGYGTDGRGIYLYGEAWDFGEVAGNQRGRNASQLNTGGTRIGAFNDRMRDGAMGGSPFEPPDTQGFVTGLYTDPNGAPHQGGPAQQLETLLHRTDWVRSALAGNIRDYELTLADGRVLPGRRATYHATSPLAYGVHPEENIVYNGCHDNETVFDQVTLKAAAGASAEQRARMCRLALSLAVLAQGVPFVHAGDDLLRSKSLDRDSYNSGDHFNRVDWTGADNNFGVGLPPASKNRHAWPLKRPLLAAAAAYKPTPADIQASAAYLRALLRVRYSSPLFRLPDSDQIKRQVAFENTGPTQVPGVVVMRLLSASAPGPGGTFDPSAASLLVVFNARPAPHAVPYPPGVAALRLHPALAELAGSDAAVAGCRADDGARAVTVAARTAAVFVEPRA